MRELEQTTRRTAPPPLLTPAEADRLLRYPRGRCARLARAGKLPHLKLPDGELRFPADLLDLLDVDPHPHADRPPLRLASGDEGGAA